MARKTRRRRRHNLPRFAPSASIAGYTRMIALEGTPAANYATSLITQDFPDVVTPPEETVNRKIVRVSGQAMFAASLDAGKHVAAQFCLWAHPKHEEWPAISKYDPFNEGPGESGFEGMLAPRTFCRRTFLLNSAGATSTATVMIEEHRVKTRAERLLRPGWILTAGLYLRGDTVACSWRGLLRAVVAG